MGVGEVRLQPSREGVVGIEGLKRGEGRRGIWKWKWKWKVRRSELRLDPTVLSRVVWWLNGTPGSLCFETEDANIEVYVSGFCCRAIRSQVAVTREKGCVKSESGGTKPYHPEARKDK
jgi:hypothetical protein